MIKCRYMVQIEYSADMDETDPNVLSFDEIKNVAANATNVLEKFLLDECFDTRHGEKLIVTEILNSVTKE